MRHFSFVPPRRRRRRRQFFSPSHHPYFPFARSLLSPQKNRDRTRFWLPIFRLSFERCSSYHSVVLSLSSLVLVGPRSVVPSFPRFRVYAPPHCCPTPCRLILAYAFFVSRLERNKRNSNPPRARLRLLRSSMAPPLAPVSLRLPSRCLLLLVRPRACGRKPSQNASAKQERICMFRVRQGWKNGQDARQARLSLSI